MRASEGLTARWSLAFLTAAALAAPRTLAAQSQGAPLHKGHVDVTSGLYIREDEDLVVPGRLPIVLKRTYLSGDRVSRHFGIGTTHAGEWYLIGEPGAFNWAALILADGGRIHFTRASEGETIENAVFRHTETPTNFHNARLEWDKGTWALKFEDGGLARFQSCGPGEFDICALIELRNADGDRIEYVRNRRGDLVSMRSGDRHIVFEYDARRRIVGASDSAGHSVVYEYDAPGRLRRVETSEGVVRTYTYGDKDELLTVDEPGWFLTNTFDADGRVVRQTNRFSRGGEALVFELSYEIVDGHVLRTDVAESGEGVTRYRFDRERTVKSVTYDPDTSDEISVTYDLAGPLARGMTVRCAGPAGPAARTVPATQAVSNDIKWLVIARECRSGLRALRFRD